MKPDCYFHQTIRSADKTRRFDLYADDLLVESITLGPHTLSSISSELLTGVNSWQLKEYDIEHVESGVFLLKRTTYETYEYDDAKLRVQFAAAFEQWKEKWIADGFPPLSTEKKQWEWYLIDLFEKHDGSQYGDELFGQIDVDYGIELLTRSEFD